jgi:TonB family protein
MRVVSFFPSTFGGRIPTCVAAACLVLFMSACSDDPRAELRDIRGQIQVAYGNDDFKTGAGLAEKGLSLSRKTLGDDSSDALYFAQAASENRIGLGESKNAIAALRREIGMRAAAGQPESRLQSRRTLLIKYAEENSDFTTAADQAVAVAHGINMNPEKDPQPVYRTATTYPPDLYRQRLEGDVEITYSLDTGGSVTDARVARSTPPQVFDQAALESFRKWRFTPMLDNGGQPIAVSGRSFTLAFRLGR